MIQLVTLNARYIHASLGLHYLYANMGELQAQTRLHEFILQDQPVAIAERLLAEKPRIIGIGVYIWNVTESTALAALLRTLAPEVTLVLGGPEVSHELAGQAIADYADHVIQGPADLAFAALCQQLLAGETPPKVISAEAPDLSRLTLPYDHYSDDDLHQRVVYVEASRGCPYRCQFCLSALDRKVENFPLDRLLAALGRLHARGLRHFKFVDRTFNLRLEQCRTILEFFLDRLDDALLLHFELVPDRLPEGLRELILRFPPGQLQFEVGVQSLDPEVQARIDRRQDNAKSLANIRWLREASGAHLHTDLIFGLPGETLASIAHGFDSLIGLGVQEVQLGLLKRLRGAPIAMHSEAFAMRYDPAPPYIILANSTLDFFTLRRLARVARYWDMIGNSGRFPHTRPLLLGAAPFDRLLALSDWLYATTQQTHQIALPRLFGLLLEGLPELFALDAERVQAALTHDYAHNGIKGPPPWQSPAQGSRRQRRAGARQQRHAEG